MIHHPLKLALASFLLLCAFNVVKRPRHDNHVDSNGDAVRKTSNSFVKRLLSTTKNPVEHQSLWHGDVVPTWDSVVSNYGTETAQMLVDEGIMEMPEGASGQGSIPKFYPNQMWVSEPTKTGFYKIYIHFDDAAFSRNEQKKMKNWLRNLQRKTFCMKFKFIRQPRTNSKPFLKIVKKDGCYSPLGKTEEATSANGQEISIGDGCLSKGTVQHEMMHALGFDHEQSRPDRDQYVTINTSNIEQENLNNFDIGSYINTLESPYDYASVMHYSAYAFAINDDVKTIDAGDNEIGEANVASPSDVLQIQLMYQCSTGPRTLSEFNANTCTSECTCGRKMSGCGTDDDLCKGWLVCQNDICVPPM